MFQPQRYFKRVDAGNRNILSWKSKRLSGESIKLPTTSNIILNPTLNFIGTKARIKFSGDCLKQERITYTYGKTVNIYIVYEIEESVNISNYPTLENCFFGAVKLEKHVDIDQYKYLRYGIGFDREVFFSVSNELCLGNISKDWSVDSMKKTSLKGYAYDFSVDYGAIEVSDILDVHKYLMGKNDIV